MSISRFKLGHLAFAAAVVLSMATSAHATDFEFSYKFDDASFITGSLSGDLDGLFVDNISNVHLSMNGNDFSGASLFAANWNTAISNWDNTTAARVSTDASLNNFIFADSNVPTDFGASNYFYMVNDPASLGHEAFATNLNTGDIADDLPMNGSWDLHVSAVPESDTSAMFMAGFSVLGLIARRRRNKA